MDYKEFHGMHQEDAHLRDFFPDYSYLGVFLDVGAGHPEKISNSYHFRMNGWRIISVEPNPYLAEEHRKRGYEVIECAVGAAPGAVSFDCYKNDRGWGGNLSETACEKGSEYEIIQVSMRKLVDILDEDYPGVVIDILDMDIELSERPALEGLCLEKYSPRICLIEDHTNGQDGLDEYMAQYGYRLDARRGVDCYFIK